MKRILLLLLYLFSCIVVDGQTTVKLLFSIEKDADFVSADILGNIYIVKGSELIKYNEKGSICCTFSNRNYGAITSIDARDPLRVLLFYKPFGIVLLLDNNLAEQSKIELRNLDIHDPLLVCSSEIQGIWVYDNATTRLYKFNDQLQAVSLSNDLRQDVMNNINPVLMMESDYWLVIQDVSRLLVFDKMGNYFKSIVLLKAEKGQLIHDEWFYASNGKLMRLNLRNGNLSEVALPFPTLNSGLVLTAQQLLRLIEKRIEIYSF